MTMRLKAEIMLAILNLAPTKDSRREFAKLAAEGNAGGIWTYYQRAIATRPDIEASVAKSQHVTFGMLLPAVKAVYERPTSDGREARH